MREQFRRVVHSIPPIADQEKLVRLHKLVFVHKVSVLLNLLVSKSFSFKKYPS